MQHFKSISIDDIKIQIKRLHFGYYDNLDNGIYESKNFIKINNVEYNKFETDESVYPEDQLKPFINKKEFMQTIELINEFSVQARVEYDGYFKLVIGLHILVMLFLIAFAITDFDTLFVVLLFVYIASVLFFIACSFLQKKFLNRIIKRYYRQLNAKYKDVGLIFKCDFVLIPIDKSNNDKFIQEELTIYYPNSSIDVVTIQ